MRTNRVRALVCAIVTVVALGASSGLAAAGADPAPTGNQQASAFQPQAYHWLTNYNSRKCLVVQGFGNNHHAFQFDCLPYTDQYWQFEWVGGPYYRIRNYNSGKCLLVRGHENGNVAVQYDCLGYADQHWTVEGSGGYFMLRNRNSQKCLVVQGFGNGHHGFQFDCNPAYLDQWWFQS